MSQRARKKQSLERSTPSLSSSSSEERKSVEKPVADDESSGDELVMAVGKTNKRPRLPSKSEDNMVFAKNAVSNGKKTAAAGASPNSAMKASMKAAPSSAKKNAAANYVPDSSNSGPASRAGNGNNSGSASSSSSSSGNQRLFQQQQTNQKKPVAVPKNVDSQPPLEASPEEDSNDSSAVGGNNFQNGNTDSQMSSFENKTGRSAATSSQQVMKKQNLYGAAQNLYYTSKEYLDRLSEEQRLLKRKRDKFVYREPEFISDAEVADAEAQNDMKSALLLSPRSAALRGLTKITKHNGRSGKQDLISRILCRWWYCSPVVVESDEVEKEKQAAYATQQLEKNKFAKLSFEDFYEKVRKPADDFDAEQAAAAESIAGDGSKSKKKSGKKKTKAELNKERQEFEKTLVHFVYEMGDFPGVFRNFKGDLFDFRKPRMCYNLLEKKTEAELKVLLETGLRNQRSALEEKMEKNKWSFPYDTDLWEDLTRQLDEIVASIARGKTKKKTENNGKL
ncbi:unnamed protein product [Amoebophrya sp. A120]|nr:unnamed protein product [Amoebophrya sp. A120]|eukprot:GSA120T00004929001.1